jgi:hypothetical protein
MDNAYLHADAHLFLNLITWKSELIKNGTHFWINWF